MKIQKETVDHVARLASLALTPEEIERYTTQLSRIIDYIDQLQQLNLEGVSRFQHTLPRQEFYRMDKAVLTMDAQEVLKQAPEAESEYFKVPRVLGGETE